MNKRLLYILIPVILLCLCESCYHSHSGSSVFTIATLKGPSAMGMIKMIDSLNNSTGNSVQIKILNEPLQVRKMMLDGSADFAILPTTMAAIAYNKGLKYQLIGIATWGTLYLSGSDSTVKTWHDLKGKRVFVMARGMTPDVMFRYILRKNGIVPDRDITLDYSFPTHIDLANAMAAGQAPIGVISEPLASLVSKKNKAVKVIFSLEDEWKKVDSTSVTETAFLGKANVLQSNMDLVNKIVSEYISSTDWVNQNPGKASELIVRYGILPDTSVARNSIPGSNLKFIRAACVSKQINDYLNIFYKQNPDIIGGKMPDENFIYH